MVWMPGDGDRPSGEDARLHTPAAARNRDAILNVLRPHLPERGLVLEIASGSGEHIVHFAAACGPGLVWQPSDPDPAARASIDAWTSVRALANIHTAIDLRTNFGTNFDWTIASADVVICINMIHIAPWDAAIGLMRGAGRILPSGGVLFLYGPFRREGRHTAPSNQAFDQNLRARNPAWGVRDLEAVTGLAASNGFGPAQIYEMPANNLSVVFRRTSLAPSSEHLTDARH
jgi:SAM-dependent methyltransferase